MFTPRHVTVAISRAPPDAALELAAAIAAATGAALRVLRAPDASSALAALAREPADLLVKAAAPPRPGVRGLGDVDRRLVHEAACSVLLVRSGPRPATRRVAAAIALPDPRRGEGAAASGPDVLDAAELLARALEAQLHVLHAWTPFATAALAHTRTARELAVVRHAERLAVRSRVGEWLSGAGTPVHPRRVHLLVGLPEQILAAGAALLRLDALVVGGPHRPGHPVARLLSTADHVLPAAPCSVMVVSRRGAPAPGLGPPSPAAPGAGSPGWRSRGWRR